MTWHLKRDRAWWPLIGEAPCNFRDHITGTPDHDLITDPDVFALNFLGIVKGCIGHGYPADKHGFKTSDRRKGAGSSDLDIDADQSGQGFFGRKLMRDGPSRGSCDGS